MKKTKLKVGDYLKYNPLIGKPTYERVLYVSEKFYIIPWATSCRCHNGETCGAVTEVIAWCDGINKSCLDQSRCSKVSKLEAILNNPDLSKF